MMVGNYNCFCATLLMCLATLCVEANTVKYYVSPSGKDRVSGANQERRMTLNEAMNQVRIAWNRNKNTDYILYLASGDYEMMQTLNIIGVKNGNTLTICAEEKGKARLVGNKKITNFVNVGRADDKRIPSSARSKILKSNLSELGIRDFGISIGLYNRAELYYNGKIQQLARYPNNDFINVAEVKGMTKQNDGACDEGIITYSVSRLKSLENEDDAHLYGYWHYNWYDSYENIERINTRSKTIYLQKPYHTYGYKQGARFYVVNALSELDSPGEYYVDRKLGILYWYPVEGYRAGVDVLTLSVSKTNPMVSIVDCNQVTLDGLSLEGGRGKAIRIRNGEGNRILNCHIAQFGDNGVEIDGGKGHIVEGCLIEQLGMRGIAANGGDRATLTNANFLIKNNIIRNVSNYLHTYQQCVFFSGCGMTISHNYFTENHSSAIRLDGNNVLVEYNKIENVVTESDDQGGLDMWGDASYRGVVIRYNYWKDIIGKGITNKIAGIRLDDIISGVKIFGNVFENCGSKEFSAITVHGGKDNVVENNIFVNCQSVALFLQNDGKYWASKMSEQRTKDQLFKQVNIQSKLYQQAYPELKKDIFSKDLINTVKDNIIINCKVFLPEDYNKLIKKNNHQLYMFTPIKNLLNAENLKKYGLQPVYFEQVGVQNNIFD